MGPSGDNFDDGGRVSTDRLELMCSAACVATSLILRVHSQTEMIEYIHCGDRHCCVSTELELMCSAACVATNFTACVVDCRVIN